MRSELRLPAAACLLLCALAATADAQIKRAVPQPTNTEVTHISVHFETEVLKVRGVSVPQPGTPATPTPLPPPSIYFYDRDDNIVHLMSDVRPASDLGGADPFGLELFNFRAVQGRRPFDLVRGGMVNGAHVVPKVEDGQTTYYITWTGVELKGKRAQNLFTTVSVGTAANNPPTLTAVRQTDSESEVFLTPFGIRQAELLRELRANPRLVRISYEFGRNDPATNFTEQAASVSEESGRILVNLGRSLPARPEDYSVKFEIPSDTVRPLLEPGFAVPADADSVSVSLAVSNPPPPTERAKTEFFFDNAFTSVVNASTGKRANVGLFGLHFKPVLRLHLFNVGPQDTRKRPQWVALRPLFDADVDTQPLKTSKAPNRIVFGMDFEWGIDAGQQERGQMDKIQQYVFLNGARYDSDRDFNVQTLYWHTEFMPRFLNFEQPRDQRLRQFRRPCDPGLLVAAHARGERTALTPDECSAIIKDKARRFPVVSSYHIRPSAGYQLGGVIRREGEVNPFPTDIISRPFFKLSNAVEFKRLIQFSLDDTYYFLANAPRRRHRNYLETRLDISTGALFNVDLGSLQSAFTVKFQRGEVPPRFQPVNAFALGFKLYK